MATIQEIIDYTNSWRSTNGISEGTQLSSQQQLQFATDLQAKLGEISVKSSLYPDANIIPYNGEMGTNMAWQLAEAASKNSNGDMIYITDTPAGQLMKNGDFADAVTRAVGDPNLANAILGGADVNGVRSPYGVGDVLSVNDYLSERAMLANAKGDVITFTANATADSVWAQTELPSLLRSSDVTSINGLPKADLLDMINNAKDLGYSEANALAIVREAISLKSRTDLADLQIAKNANGEIVWTDAAKLIGESVPSMPTEAVTTCSGKDLMGPLTQEQAVAYSELRTFTNEYYTAKYGTAIETAGKALGVVGGFLMAIDAAFTAMDAYDAYQAGDAAKGDKIIQDWTLSTMGAIAAGCLAFEGAAALFAPLALFGPLGIAAGVAGTVTVSLIAAYGGLLGGKTLSDFIASFFDATQAWVQPVRRDPLTLDLDGDGFETIAASTTNPILFDHDGDGLKTGTGWIKPDDGLLVMDRNSNGTIDNGTELFGDSTPLYAGGTATDGFAALAQEDTNFDGVVNNLDANWNNLRVWRDLNSDAISQSEELLTMDQAGIIEINVNSIAHSQVLANGNQIADLGTYTKTDGTTATMGEVSDMADINLTIDTFNREFPDEIPVAADVATLPDMEGSGLVRDLQEAATLSPILKNLLTQYSEATTRQAQMAIIDQFLDAWADTSGLAENMESRDPEHFLIRYNNFGSVSRSYEAGGYVYYSGSSSSVGIYVPDAENTSLTSVLSCRFWERTLRLDAMIRAKNQAQRSRPQGAGSALTALIGGA
ncbi:MAG: hypothetical protein CVU51_01055 [Deltaproteobacteria bacterium HGW-Deltaproteobacteria-1]|jgi:hypothetical protein|nr:MAG: hypothetical protein CVU51_01055 [Deltaproteobacteria bacterium HGW-Deltaproteobacteria-1]